MARDNVCSSVIVLTVWVEGDDPNDLRARFAVATSDAAGEGRESFAACGIDGICVRLRAWLETFARGDDPEPTLEPDGAAIP
jgi:hypothetical protein